MQTRALRRSLPRTFFLTAVLPVLWLGGCSGGGGAPPSAPLVVSYALPLGGHAVGFEFAMTPTLSEPATGFALLSGVLPPGVSFDAVTGTLSGRPLVAGISDLVIRASSADKSSDLDLTIHVVPPPAARFLYVANLDDDLLSAYRVDADTGAVRDIGMAQTGDQPRVVAMAPAATHVAVGTRIDGVWMFALDPADGRPIPVASTPLLLGSEVRDLVFHPAGGRLYVLTTAGPTEDRIFQLAFDAASGALTPLSPASLPAPDNCTSLAIDPLGRGLYLAHAGALSSFTVAGDGTLTPAADRSTGTTPVDIAVAPDGSAAYAVHLGSSDVYRFPIGGGGALKAGAPVATLAGSFPLAMAFSGSGANLYVGEGSGTIEQFRREADGSLTALSPASVSVDGDLRGLVGDPTGAGAWATRGTLNDVVALDGKPNGGLAPDLETPVRTHRQPHGLAVAPGLAPVSVVTTHLYAVNSDDDDLNQFSIQPDGTLAALAPALVPTGQGPGFVTVHPFLDALYVANGTDVANAIQTFSLNLGGAAQDRQPFPASAAGRAMLVGANGDRGHAVLEDAVVPVDISATGQLTLSAGAPFAVVVTGRPAQHPNGRWLYLPNGNLGAVLSYAVDLDDGSLVNTGGAAADPGTLAVAVDPTGRFLYAVNDGPGSDRVRGYAIHPSAGTLSELAGSPYEFNDMARDAIDVAVHPSGRRVYVATRDSDAVPGQGSIQVFAIEVDPGSGADLGGLDAVGNALLFMGQAPGDLELDASGTFLYVAIEDNPSSVLAFALKPNGNLPAAPIEAETTGTATRSIGLRRRLK